jgi:hypothetical protein
MAIHHLDWDDEEDAPKPGEGGRSQEAPPIDEAPVPPLTTPDETEGG